MNVTMAWSVMAANAKTYVNDVLESGWLSRHKYIPTFEQAVAKMHGAKYGILVNSGTDALRISLATLKEVYRWRDGSRVMVPAVTFVATVNAVLQNRLRPVFVDVRLNDANLLESAYLHSQKAVAIVPVHLFGLPVCIKPTALKVVEDSCEAFGVHRIRGEMACFSFYVSHHISTGAGGMILTNSATYEKIARSYMNHGRVDDGTHFKFGRSGYSSRSTEMEAALGCAALERFSGELSRRWTLARHYTFGLGDLDAVQKPPMAMNHSWMFYPVLLRRGARDRLMKHLRNQGIESREAMPLINQKAFKGFYKKGSCPNAEIWTKNGLLLPLHPKMSEEDVVSVCKAVKGYFNE